MTHPYSRHHELTFRGPKRQCCVIGCPAPHLKVVHGWQPLKIYSLGSFVTAILLFPDTISSKPFNILILFSLNCSSASGKLVTGNPLSPLRISPKRSNIILCKS